jgi:hypothetical protein
VRHVVTGTENLSLDASGPVTTNVWVTGNNKLRRISMKLQSDAGYIEAKVVRLRWLDFSSKVK